VVKIYDKCPIAIFSWDRETPAEEFLFVLVFIHITPVLKKTQKRLPKDRQLTKEKIGCGGEI
jgi:hypothetical protein